MAKNTLLNRIFNRVSPENPSTSLSKPAQWLTSLFGTKSTSGQQITANSVISIPAFWRAVNILGETIASLPFEVIKEDETGNIVIEKMHPVQRIINVEPSKHYTSFTYRHTSIVHAILFGDWISLIKFNSDQRPERLIILDPSLVVVKYTENDVIYEVKSGVYEGEYSSSEIIHVPGLSFNGMQGLNPMQVMADTFGMGLSSREYINSYHSKGSMIAGVIQFPHTMTDEQYDRLKTSFKLEYAGTKGAGTTPLLEGGAQYKQVNANLSDSKSLDTLKFNIADVSRITGIPPHMLADLERATFSNIEHQTLEFAMFTIRPWVKRIEQEFNRKIFRTNEIGDYKVRLNMDALLRGDTESRAKLYQALWGIGAISRNEIRKREKMNPVDGGDRFFVPLNHTPLDDDGNPMFAPKSSVMSEENE